MPRVINRVVTAESDQGFSAARQRHARCSDQPLRDALIKRVICMALRRGLASSALSRGVAIALPGRPDVELDQHHPPGLNG
jgi:hypothetical protein